MKRIIKWLAWTLIACVVLCILLIFNPNLVKAPLQNYLGDLTGYSISLDGDLGLNPGSVTTISVTNASVSSVILPGQDELLGLGRLELALRTASLFEETIIIERIYIDETRLNLALDANRQSNWQSPPKAVPEDQDKEAGKRLLVKDIRVTTSDVNYANHARQVEHHFRIESFRLTHTEDGMLESELNGQLNQRMIEVASHFGPYGNLHSGANIVMDIEGILGSLSIQGEARFDNLYAPMRPEFNVSLQSTNIDDITAMLKVDDLGTGDFQLTASSTATDDGVKAAVRGSIGDISIDISTLTQSLSEFEQSAMKLKATGPSLGALMRAVGRDEWPDEPFDITAELARSGKLLDVTNARLNIADVHVNMNANLRDFPHLTDGRANININGENIQRFQGLLNLPDAVTGDFELAGKLDVVEDGSNEIDIQLVTDLGQARLSGSLGEAPSYVGSRFELLASGDRLARVLSAAGVDGLPDKPFRLNTRARLEDEGLQISRAEFGLAKDTKLLLTGLITLNPGLTGSRLDLDLQASNFSSLFEGVGVEQKIPGGPFNLKGRVERLDEGLALSGVTASLNDLTINTEGLVSLQEKLAGSRFDFKLEHPDISGLSSLGVPGNVLEFFQPGQSLQGSGQLVNTAGDWRFSNIIALIGSTELDIDVLLVSSPTRTGSFVDFYLRGSDSHQLVAERIASRLAGGRFAAKGRLSLQESALQLALHEVNSERGEASIDLTLDWPVRDEPSFIFDIDARGSDISILNAPGRAFQLAPEPFSMTATGSYRQRLTLDRFDVVIGSLEIKLTGEISSFDADPNGSIRLNGHSDDVSSLGSLNGDPLPAQPLQLQADITGEKGLFTFKNLSLKSGNSDILANASIDLSTAKPRIRLQARSELVDLRPFQKDPATREPEPDPEPNPEPRDRLIPALQVPLEQLQSIDAGLQLVVKELKFKNASYHNLSIDSQLEAGALDVNQFSFDAPRGGMTASLALKPVDDRTADVKLDLSTSEFSMNIRGLDREEHEKVPLLDAEIHLSGSGADLQQIAATSNGYASFKSQGGVLENVDLSVLELFILDAVFKLILPKSDAVKSTYLTCAAAFIKVEDGMLETEPAIAFTTDALTLVSDGTINLGSEEIRFNFNATPNNALKISATELFNPYILVKGTITQPEVSLDPGKTLILGSAAVGTAGLSVLAKGLWDRVSNTKPLCEEMLKTDYRPGEAGLTGQ